MNQNSRAILIISIIILIIGGIWWYFDQQRQWYLTMRSDENQPYDIELFFKLLNDEYGDIEPYTSIRDSSVLEENTVVLSFNNAIGFNEIRSLDSLITEGLDLVIVDEQINSDFLPFLSPDTNVRQMLDQFLYLNDLDYYNYEESYDYLTDSIQIKIDSLYEEQSDFDLEVDLFDSITSDYYHNLRNHLFGYRDLYTKDTLIHLSDTTGRITSLMFYQFGYDTVEYEWAHLNSEYLKGLSINKMDPIIVDDHENIHGVRIYKNKGSITFIQTPLIFTNHLLANGNTFDLVNYLMQSTHAEKLRYYDIRFSRFNSQSNSNPFGDSPVSFILSQKSLRLAWYFTLAILVLFGLFQIKRQQRAIPILEPFQNLSLGYAKAIALLQFGSSNRNQTIGDEIYRFFKTNIENRINLPFHTFNHSVEQHLLRVLPKQKKLLAETFYLLRKLESKAVLDNEELVRLYNNTRHIISEL